ncbi:CHAT domain-containing protein [Streptomyces sp. NPDC059752]|uniref:CHAT domain-containing protein n=1 Tax=unclassified Streptomyces TaxID=2593676 RepID=UPI003661CC30
MTDPTQSLQEARDALDAVIAEIQQVPGFADFLAAPTFGDIAEAAREQPVVYLAAAESGGLALVVRGEDVTEVNLPRLTRESVGARVRGYLERYAEHRAAETGTGGDRTGADEARLGARRGWDEALAEITNWLWSTAMGPLVEEFAAPGVSGVRAPKVTLVPGGLLGLLPLHAAWRPDPSRPTGREHAVDLLEISYAPNARALSAARAIADAVPGRRILAVAPPTRANDLRMPAAEARAARLAFAGGVLERRPTAGRFVTQMATADVVHVACHGLADLTAPLNSRLILAPGEEVTLAMVMAQEVKIRLAVLSACETLLPGTELPDEVVSLPTGLLQAGAAGVIASMWAVPDLASALLMIEFYRHWRDVPDDPAAALRQAQIWLRDSTVQTRVERFESVQEWPPPSVSQEVLNRLALLASAADGTADLQDGTLAEWAAFAHVGV